MTENKHAVPDVNQIMQDITHQIEQAEASLPSTNPSDLKAENDLYEALRQANETHALYAPPPWAKGPKNWLRTKSYALLLDTFESINSFHIHTLHALNKITKLIDGSHDEITGKILTKTGNRMDLIEALSERIAKLEKRLNQLENENKRMD